MKPRFFKNLKEASEACDKLGIDSSKLKTMAQMAAAYDGAIRAGKRIARKPGANSGKSIPPIVPKGHPDSPIAPDNIQSIQAAIDNESNPGRKADLYGKMSANLLDKINKETDAVKRTELTRAYQRSEKNRAYSLHAFAQLDPKAARAAKLMRLVE